MNKTSFLLGLSFAFSLVAFGAGYWSGQRNANAALSSLVHTMQGITFRQGQYIKQLEAKQPVVDPFGEP